jgi:hypothetical protein
MTTFLLGFLVGAFGPTLVLLLDRRAMNKQSKEFLEELKRRKGDG